MSTTSQKSRKRLAGDSYLALVLEHPLKAIKTRAGYDAASAALDRLAMRENLDTGEEEYLETLEVLITACDDKQFPDTPDARPPLERLKAILESSQITPAQLQKILGSSQAMVSMILSGQRELSKKAIAKLAQRFKVEPGYFL